MFRAHHFAVLLLCAVILTTAGCTSSQVRLRYLPDEAQNATTIQTNTTYGLVQFADNRTTPNIGIDDGKNLSPVSNVASWVTHGLEQKLVQKGAVVHYVLSEKQLKNVPVRISGTISKLWVQRLSAGKYQGDMVLTISINDNPPTTYSASVTRQGVPYMNNIEPLLAELLNEALTPAIPHLLATR